MDILREWFCKDVRPVGGSGDFGDTKCASKNMVAKMVEFEGDVLGTWAKLSLAMSEGDAGRVVLVNGGGREGCCGSHWAG